MSSLFTIYMRANIVKKKIIIISNEFLLHVLTRLFFFFFLFVCFHDLFIFPILLYVYDFFIWFINDNFFISLFFSNESNKILRFILFIRYCIYNIYYNIGNIFCFYYLLLLIIFQKINIIYEYFANKFLNFLLFTKLLYFVFFNFC